MTDSMKEFSKRYWSGLEDEQTYEATDADDVPVIPVNANPYRALNAFALRLTGSLETDDAFAYPSLQVRKEGSLYAVWFIARIDVGEGALRQINLLRQIRHQYAVRLGGEPVNEIPNPLFYDDAVIWRDSINQLSTMRAAIRYAKKWQPSTPPEFLSRGGASTSPAKVEAARANWDKAREAKADKALDRARERIMFTDSLEPEKAAEAIGCTTESLPVLIRRARSRVKAAETEARVLRIPQRPGSLPSVLGADYQPARRKPKTPLSAAEVAEILNL